MTSADDSQKNDRRVVISAPPALVFSCAFGALGLVLLVAGAVSGAEGLFVAAFVMGSLSLGSALYWRSELISDWKRGKRSPGPRGPMPPRQVDRPR